MPSDPWFELCEQHAFTGSTSWRLKGGHIRFRGRTNSNEPLPAIQPISPSQERIDDFVKTLDFLDVWHWRPGYTPEECGFVVMDGMSWTFTGSLGGREINAGGDNAYPSFADVAECRSKLSDTHFLSLRSIARSAYRCRTIHFVGDSISPLQ